MSTFVDHFDGRLGADNKPVPHEDGNEHDHNNAVVPVYYLFVIILKAEGVVVRYFSMRGVLVIDPSTKQRDRDDVVLFVRYSYS